jgi:hypothetical protein
LLDEPDQMARLDLPARGRSSGKDLRRRRPRRPFFGTFAALIPFWFRLYRVLQVFSELLQRMGTLKWFLDRAALSIGAP